MNESIVVRSCVSISYWWEQGADEAASGVHWGGELVSRSYGKYVQAVLFCSNHTADICVNSITHAHVPEGIGLQIFSQLTGRICFWQK